MQQVRPGHARTSSLIVRARKPLMWLVISPGPWVMRLYADLGIRTHECHRNTLSNEEAGSGSAANAPAALVRFAYRSSVFEDRIAARNWYSDIDASIAMVVLEYCASVFSEMPRGACSCRKRIRLLMPMAHTQAKDRWRTNNLQLSVAGLSQKPSRLSVHVLVGGLLRKFDLGKLPGPDLA